MFYGCSVQTLKNRIFKCKIYNKTEVHCDVVKHTISLDELITWLLDEFVFIKYFKLRNFKLSHGQLYSVILSV